MRLLAVLSLVVCANAWGAERLVRDATGLVLGEFVSIESESIAMTTSRGYLVVVGNGGEIRHPGDLGEWVIYRDALCSGQRYVTNLLLQPIVYRSEEGVVYVPDDAETIRLGVGDVYYIWSTVYPNPNPNPIPNPQPECHLQEVGPDSSPFITPFFPNDPGVTGIGNGPFLPPFKISAVVVLRDGFEGA